MSPPPPTVPLPADRHRPWCTGPAWEWQERFWADLPTRGRCQGCDAVTVSNRPSARR